MDTKNSDTVEKDRTLINRLTYLASLASESRVIDPMLDPLREITANWKKVEPLESRDRSQLTKLEGELKNFLIKKDPLRSFTAEDLEYRIRLREAAQPRLNSFIIALLVSFAAGGIAYLLPIQQLTLENRHLMAACTQMLVAQLITVWFYLTNLKNFKQEFRQAFFYISLGILPLGVLFGQIGISQTLGFGEIAPFRYAGVSYFATLAFILMFIGLRKYARLLTIKTKASSLIGVCSTSVVVAAAMVLIPHTSSPKYELFFDISLAAIMVAFVFAIANTILIYKVMHVVTTAYRKPLLILYIYMYAAVFGTAVAGGALYALGELYGENLAIVILFAAIPQQLLLLYSGYQFKKHIGR